MCGVTSRDQTGVPEVRIAIVGGFVRGAFFELFFLRTGTCCLAHRRGSLCSVSFLRRSLYAVASEALSPFRRASRRYLGQRPASGAVKAPHPITTTDVVTVERDIPLASWRLPRRLAMAMVMAAGCHRQTFE